MNLSLIPTCDLLRKDLLSVETDIRVLQKANDFDNPESRPGQHAEIRANIQLALRHVEDARMRLGKCIQHAGTGISCNDAAERSAASHLPAP